MASRSSVSRAILIVAVVLTALPSGVSFAASVTGTASDALDQAGKSSFGVAVADVASVHVVFDATAGAERTDIGFYGPADTDRLGLQEFMISLGTLMPDGTCTQDVTLKSGMSPDAYSFLLNPWPPPRSVRVNTLWSADGRTLSVYVANLALIGRVETCATAMTAIFSRPGCGAVHDCPEDTVGTFPLVSTVDRAVDVTLLGVLGFHSPANMKSTIGAYTRASQRVGVALARCRTGGCASHQVQAFRYIALRSLHDYIADDTAALAPCGASAQNSVNHLNAIDNAWSRIQKQLVTRKLATLAPEIKQALALSVSAVVGSNAYRAACGPGAAPSSHT